MWLLLVLHDVVAWWKLVLRSATQALQPLCSCQYTQGGLFWWLARATCPLASPSVPHPNRFDLNQTLSDIPLTPPPAATCYCGAITNNHTRHCPSLAGPQLPADYSSVQHEDNAARRALLHTLAGVFLPLVPSITRPDHCTRPLWACAKTGYGWAGGAAEVALAEALLGRLGEDGCALMRRAKPQEHASLWWSLSEAPNTSRLVAAQGQLLAASAECLVGMSARDMVPQNCANVLLACARLKHSPTHVPLVHHLTRCLAQLSDAKPQELSNSLYALGELREDCGHVPHREDLHQLVGAVVQRLRVGQRAREEVAGVFKPQHLSNMLLGCAKVGVEDGEAVQLLAAAAGVAAGRMTGQGLANSVWALGKLLGGGDVGCLASPSLGAGGEAGGTAALAVTQLLSEVQRRLGPSAPKNGTAEHALEGQHLSNLLYGMALLQPYMDTMTPAQGGMQGSPGGQAVTSFAAATHALAGECVRRSFRGFEPQHLANATWALAKMGHADQGWFAAAVAAAQRPAFSGPALPMHLAQVWYALALVRHRPPPGLMECTAGALEGHVRRAEPQQCASLLWSFAILGVWEERLAGVLLGRLAELVEQQQQQGKGRQDAQGPGAGRGGAGGGGAGQASLLVKQAVANALWAVAVEGPEALAAHAREVGVLLREAARQWEQGGGWGPGESFDSEALHQLWQVQLELEAMDGGGTAARDMGRRSGHTARRNPHALASILPGAKASGGAGGAIAAPEEDGSLLGAMELAAEAGRLGDAPTVSSMQREVLTALQRLQRSQQQERQLGGKQGRQTHAAPQPEGLAVGSLAGRSRLPQRRSVQLPTATTIASVQHEAHVPALSSRVDVLVRLSDGRVVAVEVDGPTHFLGNEPHQDTRQGRTVLRDRQLARVFGQGNVVCVPYWEWRAVKGDEAAAEAYLWGLLVGAEGRSGDHAHARQHAAAAGPTSVQAQNEVGVEAAAAAAGTVVTAAAPLAKSRQRRVKRQEQEQLEQVELSKPAASAPSCDDANVEVPKRVASSAPVVHEQEGPVRVRGRRPRAAAQQAADGLVVSGGAAAAPEIPQTQMEGKVAQWLRLRRLAAETAASGAGQGGQPEQVRHGRVGVVVGTEFACVGRASKGS